MIAIPIGPPSAPIIPPKVRAATPAAVVVAVAVRCAAANAVVVAVAAALLCDSY